MLGGLVIRLRGKSASAIRINDNENVLRGPQILTRIDLVTTLLELPRKTTSPFRSSRYPPNPLPTPPKSHLHLVVPVSVYFHTSVSDLNTMTFIIQSQNKRNLNSTLIQMD